MKAFFSFIWKFLLPILGIIDILIGVFTDQPIFCVIGFLFFVLYDNQLTHKKLRELETTIMVCGATTILAITKGKVDVKPAD